MSMMSKNNENIYGYTGKKTPNFNFVSQSLQSSIKKQTFDLKPKPVIIKNDKPTELLIKSLIFRHNLSDNLVILNIENENLNFNQEIKNLNNLLHKKIVLELDEDIYDLYLLPHEKGISIKINTFDIYPHITVDGEKQTIEFTKNRDYNVKIFESKICFKNPEFPFHYIYEASDKYDGIFNDFIESNLPEIRPPTLYTVPSKHTKNEISFRQYISYIKTNTFINFKVDERGWVFDSFTNSYEELPNGVLLEPLPYWIYHPRCQRIEHFLQFQ